MRDANLLGVPVFWRTEINLNPSDEPSGHGPVVFAVYPVTLSGTGLPQRISTNLDLLIVLAASLPLALFNLQIMVAFNARDGGVLMSNAITVVDESVIVLCCVLVSPEKSKTWPGRYLLWYAFEVNVVGATISKVNAVALWIDLTTWCPIVFAEIISPGTNWVVNAVPLPVTEALPLVIVTVPFKGAVFAVPLLTT